MLMSNACCTVGDTWRSAAGPPPLRMLAEHRVLGSERSAAVLRRGCRVGRLELMHRRDRKCWVASGASG